MSQRKHVRMAMRVGGAALLLLCVGAVVWVLFHVQRVKEEPAEREVKRSVEKRIQMVSFIKSGGFAGVHEGWVIRDGKSPAPNPVRGIEDLRAEVIEWRKISELVETMVKLDQTSKGRGGVADAFEYRFIVGFEDGTQISAWRMDFEGGGDLQRFLETGGKIREVVLAV